MSHITRVTETIHESHRIVIITDDVPFRTFGKSSALAISSITIPVMSWLTSRLYPVVRRFLNVGRWILVPPGVSEPERDEDSLTGFTLR
jgi:CBS domain containing-hemolysin-like protein